MKQKGNLQMAGKDDRKNRILLVIDLQEAFKTEPYYSLCNEYIKNHGHEYKQVIRTYFANPMRYTGSGREEGRANENYIKFLGYAIDGLDTKERVKLARDPRNIIKNGYIIPGNFSIITSSGYLPEKVPYDIIGCDTDGSVMAVAFQFFSKGYDFHILTKYCFSTGGEQYHSMAVELMKKNFGSAVVEG